MDKHHRSRAKAEKANAGGGGGQSGGAILTEPRRELQKAVDRSKELNEAREPSITCG